MVMVWANGNCAIRAGYFQNSRRLVTEADFAPARTSVTTHAEEKLSSPWMGCWRASLRRLPSAGLNTYLVPFAQKASSSRRLAHGPRNGIPHSVGLAFSPAGPSK